jgi:hypothetical protein
MNLFIQAKKKSIDMAGLISISSWSIASFSTTESAMQLLDGISHDCAGDQRRVLTHTDLNVEVFRTES